jgi:hypothetical protein
VRLARHQHQINSDAAEVNLVAHMANLSAHRGIVRHNVLTLYRGNRAVALARAPILQRPVRKFRCTPQASR